jgi:hypothetical protein
MPVVSGMSGPDRITPDQLALTIDAVASKPQPARICVVSNSCHPQLAQ